MKVAIVTLHRVYNYGSALQAYATQKIFEESGHDVRMIDYITPQRTKRRIFFGKSADGTGGIVYRLAKIGSLALKELTFGSFVRKRMNLTKKYITADDLQKDPPEADVYVTGSDQTWNSAYNEGVDRGFFLDFIPEKCKRMAFVASFGKKKLDEAEIAETRKYIQRYGAISVREDSALRILEDELGYHGAVQLIDPTLQIPKEHWLELASKRLVPERYLILMLLYNEDNHATEYARKLADEKGLKLVKISWEMSKPPLVDQLFTHRSPADFLSLFAHADFVVTNSFHGLAFSINLERQFIVVPRNEFNSRIDSLLKLTGLEQRLISAEEQLIEDDKGIEYEKVRTILEQERRRAADFINDILN